MVQWACNFVLHGLVTWRQVANPLPDRLIFLPKMYSWCTHFISEFARCASGTHIVKYPSVVVGIWASDAFVDIQADYIVCENETLLNVNTLLNVSSKYFCYDLWLMVLPNLCVASQRWSQLSCVALRRRRVFSRRSLTLSKRNTTFTWLQTLFLHAVWSIGQSVATVLDLYFTGSS